VRIHKNTTHNTTLTFLSLYDDFITAEYKKARARGEMSRYNYDAQKAGKAFKMNPSHHVPLRQMIHTGGMNSVTARIADKSSPIFFSAEWASGNNGESSKL
jgi:hypothetical protein